MGQQMWRSTSEGLPPSPYVPGQQFPSVFSCFPDHLQQALQPARKRWRSWNHQTKGGGGTGIALSPSAAHTSVAGFANDLDLTVPSGTQIHS